MFPFFCSKRATIKGERIFWQLKISLIRTVKKLVNYKICRGHLNSNPKIREEKLEIDEIQNGIEKQTKLIFFFKSFFASRLPKNMVVFYSQKKGFGCLFLKTFVVSLNDKNNNRKTNLARWEESCSVVRIEISRPRGKNISPPVVVERSMAMWTSLLFTALNK